MSHSAVARVWRYRALCELPSTAWTSKGRAAEGLPAARRSEPSWKAFSTGERANVGGAGGVVGLANAAGSGGGDALTLNDATQTPTASASGRTLRHGKSNPSSDTAGPTSEAGEWSSAGASCRDSPHAAQNSHLALLRTPHEGQSRTSPAIMAGPGYT